MPIRLRVVGVGLLLILGSLVIVAPRAAADWCSNSSMSYAPNSGPAGKSVTFTFSFQNGADATLQVSDFSVTYSWAGISDFGPSVVPPYGSASGSSARVLPSSSGTVSITATVTGQASTDYYPISCFFGPMTVTVVAAPLIVSAVANATRGIAPLDVAFVGNVSGGTGPYTFAWVFGDGNTSAAMIAVHTYDRPGTFNATFTVTDAAGAHGSAAVQVVVEAPVSRSGSPGAPGGPNLPASWVIGSGLAAVAAAVGIVLLYRRSRRKKPPAEQGKSVP